MDIVDLRQKADDLKRRVVSERRKGQRKDEQKRRLEEENARLSSENAQLQKRLKPMEAVEKFHELAAERGCGELATQLSEHFLQDGAEFDGFFFHLVQNVVGRGNR